MATIADGRVHPAGEPDPIDVTKVTNEFTKRYWKCPHCGRKQRTGAYADEILLNHGKYIEHCIGCGYLHLWELTLTDDFKRKIIELLKEGKL